jgi:hypothetical protein
MPTAAGIRSIAPPSAAEVEALWQLAAKGAYAVPADAGAGASGDYAVRSAAAETTQPLGLIAAAAFAAARCRGWLAAEADGIRYRLSAAGLKALRQARSGSGRRTAKRRAGSPARSTTVHPHPAARGAQERPLAWLSRRKDKDGRALVTEPQLAAGERLACDFWHAQLMPRVTADWSSAAVGRRMRRASPGTGVEISDNVMAARQRVHRALAAVGPELAGILVDVCCYEQGLEAAERARGWSQRSGKVVLGLALTRLARHYGLIAPPPPHRLRHWGSDDYRPDLEAWR